MSTAIDARRRPSYWSYLSFSSSPRRRSISLPTRNNNHHHHHDPYEKVDRHTGNGSLNKPAGKVASLKDAWMTQSQRARLLKTGGIIAFFLFLVYVFTRHEQSFTRFRGKSSTESSSGATKCSKPYTSNKPLIQYALMIDAGSTGSRIHVYRFNNCGPTPELEKEDFQMTEKRKGGAGLSAYPDDPEAAAKSLDPLMEVAMQNVPDKYKSCSPIAVKATAGLRLLGPEKSDRILDAVRAHLETQYPFPVVSKEKNGIVIMEGKDEGVYAWITTNYLLGRIGGPDNNPTAAIFDLGGASTQIVFQPTYPTLSNGLPEKMAEGDHKYDLNFGGRHFELYQHSHLGYGLMSARESVHKAILQTLADSHANKDDLSWTKSPIVNPCIAPNTTLDVDVKLDDGSVLSAHFVGPTIPSPAQCRFFAEKILHKDLPCTLSPCSFNGIHQPSIASTFPSSQEIYIFSYFYDRTAPLGMPESFSIRELKQLTENVCAGEEKGWGVFEGVDGALEELRGRPEWCLDLNFMLGLLHTGYEMGEGREVRIAKKIKDNELGWCLGASLPLLEQDSGWKCRVKEVS